MGFVMHPMLVSEIAWSALLAVLLILLSSQQAAAQRSVPATTTQDFAEALQDQTITEIILDPSRTGTGGGTFSLRGDVWVQNTFNVSPGRDLTVRSVNGNPTMLDLGEIPAILVIRANGTLELRDMVLKNVATVHDLKAGLGQLYIRPNFSEVLGMLLWPSFYAEAGATLRIYNTTQYFWSNTVFFRPDCNYQLAGAPPDGLKVNILRGEQTYSFSAAGYTMLAESHLYHAQYPVLDFNSSRSEGYMDVYSENSYGVCVPVNSSANEVIIGMTRASVLQNSGGGQHTTVIIASVVGAAAAAALIGGVMGMLFWVQRKQREEGVRDLRDLGAVPVSPGAAMLGRPALQDPSGSMANSQMESHLLAHGRLRRLGLLNEEQVEVGPLLGRGSFGRVYKGRWRSTLVAIKVVEHSPGVNKSMTPTKQEIEREALLATSLSHPNIIATFKICTMTAGSAVGQKRQSVEASKSLSQRKPSGQQGSTDSGAGRGSKGLSSKVDSPAASQQQAVRPRAEAREEGRPGGEDSGGQQLDRDLGSGISETKPSSLPKSKQGSENKGSGDSFDPKTAFVVDLPESEEEKKGSDSAIHNGGKRPGLVGASPTDADIEMTDGELAAEDEQAAIEERMSRLLETWCLMEYAEKGSLADALRTSRLKRPNGLSELGVIIACLQDIASGMEYLHSAGILHGDLKPANVLLKSTSADQRGFLCKLCDFGMSRLLDATHATHVSTQTYGTMQYMPPELLAQSHLTPKADVYSFGIVMWELLSGQVPFADLKVGQVFFAVVHENMRPPLDVVDQAKVDLPEEEDHHTLDMYAGLMQRCWAEAPSLRPTFPEIVFELGTYRAKISMRLSGKASESSGLRQLGSSRSSVACTNAGSNSPVPARLQRGPGRG